MRNKALLVLLSIMVLIGGAEEKAVIEEVYRIEERKGSKNRRGWRIA